MTATAVDEATKRIRFVDVEIRDELVRHERRMETLREARASAVRHALEAEPTTTSR